MEKIFYIYILESIKTGRYYIGQTQDIPARLDRHNNGYVKSTKKGKPWKLVWSMEVSSRSQSMAIETKIKSWKSRKMIEGLISGEVDTANW